MFENIRALVTLELEAAEGLIRESLRSDVSLIHQIGQHIVESGGKRLRMILVLLAAKAFDYEGSAHIQLAAIIELLHTATLLHDDVVDHSQLRRGKPTANHVWGDHASVLVGDYLYSRAFQLIVQVNKINNKAVMEILAEASNQMAEGEVLQLMNCHNPDMTEAVHREVIGRKTGTLFAAAAQMGAVLTSQPEDVIDPMRRYGAHLGVAFQLVDDALDYRADPEQLGKNIGDDLAEGKPTLPLIRALSQLPSREADLLRAAIQTGKWSENRSESIKDFIQMIESTDAISYTYNAAKREAEMARRALLNIEPSVYRDGLEQLIHVALARYY